MPGLSISNGAPPCALTHSLQSPKAPGSGASNAPHSISCRASCCDSHRLVRHAAAQPSGLRAPRCKTKHMNSQLPEKSERHPPPPPISDVDAAARLLSLRPGSLDAAGTVAAIFANLLAGQCLRPQRLAGGLDTSRVVATLHPVISTRCTLCGCGIRPPCASPTDLPHASPRAAAPRTAHDASRSRVEGEGSLPLT